MDNWKQQQQQRINAACSYEEVWGTGVGMLKEFNRIKN